VPTATPVIEAAFRVVMWLAALRCLLEGLRPHPKLPPPWLAWFGVAVAFGSGALRP
jgi:hypothetical protein